MRSIYATIKTCEHFILSDSFNMQLQLQYENKPLQAGDWQRTYLQFIEPLYAWGEVQSVHITGKWWLPPLENYTKPAEPNNVPFATSSLNLLSTLPAFRIFLIYYTIVLTLFDTLQNTISLHFEIHCIWFTFLMHYFKMI